MSERGSGLLDAVAATAIGLLVASVTTDTVASIRMVGVVQQRDRLLVAARDLLEQALGEPCAASAPCPADMSCSIERVLLTAGPPPLARIRVAVEAVDPDAGVQPVPVRLSGVRIEACV
jgi:hypothetical protein